MCNTRKRSTVVVHRRPDGSFQLEETTLQDYDPEDNVVENSSPLLGLLLFVLLYWCWSWVLGLAITILQLLTLPYLLVFQVTETLSFGVSSMVLSLANLAFLRTVLMMLGLVSLLQYTVKIATALSSQR